MCLYINLCYLIKFILSFHKHKHGRLKAMQLCNKNILDVPFFDMQCKAQELMSQYTYIHYVFLISHDNIILEQLFLTYLGEIH